MRAILSGTSIKTDGTPRSWECVEYYGSRNRDHVRVLERGQVKQISMSTFSGTVLTPDDLYIYESGKVISKNTYYLPF